MNAVVDNRLFSLQIGKLRIFILVYIDDMLLTRTDAYYINELVAYLDSQFALKGWVS